jgi:hypothetical protein
LRGATPPPKNTLSHANRTRDPKMAEPKRENLQHIIKVNRGIAAGLRGKA